MNAEYIDVMRALLSREVEARAVYFDGTLNILNDKPQTRGVFPNKISHF